MCDLFIQYRIRTGDQGYFHIEVVPWYEPKPLGIAVRAVGAILYA